MDTPGRPGTTAPLARVLFVSTFLVATCGLIYELVAGALASYLLGDSVTQFSLIIGAYLSAMGVGSYLSRYLERDLLTRFVEIELAVALIGGFQAPILFAAFTWSPAFRWVLYVLIVLIGIGVGLELPLLLRILEKRGPLRELVARVMALDYVGALAASVLFPLFLLPMLGLLRASLVVGLVNAAVGLATVFVFDAAPAVRRRLVAMAVTVLAVLGVGLAGADRMTQRMEADLFADPVVASIQTPYQRLVLTWRDQDLRLFIDGALQFSSLDEYRYHESLVHPALTSVPAARRVLVLGGGDGLAVREILRHPEVEAVTLVDLDPEMTRLFSTRPELVALNRGALTDPRVTVVNVDAFQWVQRAPDVLYDAAIVDFPDPNNHGLGKLYTHTFYRLLLRHLDPEAAIAVQSTSPLFSNAAWSCIVETIRYAGLEVRPYHVYVPAFGEWGFVLASRGPLPEPRPLPDGLRFLTPEVLPTLFVFPADLAPRPAPVNRLDNQALVRIYEDEWRALETHR